jgi:hypothetical protein
MRFERAWPGSMLQPVRPGTLYTMIGSGVLSAIAL